MQEKNMQILGKRIMQSLGKQWFYGVLCTLRPPGWSQNERQAKHIVLTQIGIHPKLHEVDTSTTKNIGDVGIQLKPPTSGNRAERIG